MFHEQVAKNIQFDFKKSWWNSASQIDWTRLPHFQDSIPKWSYIVSLTHWTMPPLLPPAIETLRQSCMQPNTISSEPLNRLRMNSNHSKVTLEWLHWQEQCFPRFPSQSHLTWHAANEGEYSIPQQSIQGRQLQQTHQHHLWVPQVFLAWLPNLPTKL